jgi:two-component system copper resistance phosphate regulon response regulator CusR
MRFILLNGRVILRILVVEDERGMRDVIVRRLKEEGYGVDCCACGTDALDYISATAYDAIIMDILIPKPDGLTVVGMVRKKGNLTPVVFLTARDSVADRVKGLDCGGDDYLTKPFAYDELSARLRALLRRGTQNPTNVFTLADHTVDCDRHTVTRDGMPIALTSREFAVLDYMIRNTGIVLTRDRIVEHIWSYDYEGESNMLNVYIRYLRRKLDDDFEPKLIHTVRGVGYVMRIAP